MSPLRTASTAFVACLSACIADERPRPTTSADSADTVDTVEDTTSDSASVDSDAGSDTSASACERATDCLGALGDCQRWRCKDSVCTVDDRDGSCDDGDLCTGVGTCDHGACVPGPTLVCDEASQCGHPACDPAVGCIEEPVADGFCEASNGVAWGTCAGTRMAPPDLCGEAGQCSDRVTPETTPLPKSLLRGDWFFVSQGVHTGGYGTIAGSISFDVGGSWTGEQLLTTDGVVDASTFSDHAWCIDPAGGVAFAVGVDHYVGQMDAVGELMAASGRLANEVAVAIRPTGAVSDVDGTYAVIMANLDAEVGPQIYSGTLVFGHGCIAESSMLQTVEAGLPLSVVADKACIEPPQHGTVQLSLQLESPNGDETFPLNLYGAVGPRGDTLLFVRTTSDSTIAFGMAFVTRLSSGPMASLDDSEQWSLAFQEKQGDDSFRGFPGLLRVDGETIVNGLWDGHQVLGERVVVDAYGRFVTTLQTPDERRSFSGYLAPSGGLGVFYEVDVPSDWLTPTEVSETPIGPAFGAIVRRPQP
ncbi:MAG: hypothetical protein U1F43_16330 [Myxococcota bacterium]